MQDPTGESSLVADKNPTDSNIRSTSLDEQVALLRVRSRQTAPTIEKAQKAARQPLVKARIAASKENERLYKEVRQEFLHSQAYRLYEDTRSGLVASKKQLMEDARANIAASNASVLASFESRLQHDTKKNQLALAVAADDRAVERTK